MPFAIGCSESTNRHPILIADGVAIDSTFGPPPLSGAQTQQISGGGSCQSS